MQDAEARVRMDTIKVCALERYSACFALTLHVTTASVAVRTSVSVRIRARHLVADSVSVRGEIKAKALVNSANPDLMPRHSEAHPSAWAYN